MKKPHPTRIFKEPEELEKAWLEYKEHVKLESLKWVKVQYVGKDGDRVEEPQKVPYTMEGFEVFCYDNYGTVKHYFDNKQGYYDVFGAICLHIKQQIRQDQITGGLLGFYNPSITQRLNGLKESTETTIIEQPLFPDE
jgi:hypothetical protein